MIVGEHNRPNDTDVNVIKEKKLTNVRNHGKDENVAARRRRACSRSRRRWSGSTPTSSSRSRPTRSACASRSSDQPAPAPLATRSRTRRACKKNVECETGNVELGMKRDRLLHSSFPVPRFAFDILFLFGALRSRGARGRGRAKSSCGPRAHTRRAGDPDVALRQYNDAVTTRSDVRRRVARARRASHAVG